MSLLVRVGSNVRLLKNLGWQARRHRDQVHLWPDGPRRAEVPPLVLRLIVLQGRWLSSSLRRFIRFRLTPKSHQPTRAAER